MQFCYIKSTSGLFVIADGILNVSCEIRRAITQVLDFISQTVGINSVLGRYIQ